MKIEAIKTPLIDIGQDLAEIFINSLNQPLKEKSIVCVTSKIVSLEQNRLAKISEIKPSEKAKKMKEMEYSKHLDDHSKFAELVLRESEKIYEGMSGLVYLTYLDGVFIANAGIDLSNCPEGYAILFPENPWDWVHEFREKLIKHFKLDHLGVLMTDSRNAPLRKGITGLAIANSGFEGLESQIGKPDLFGKPLHISVKAVSDDLACAAVLVCGESGESTPFAVIEDAPVVFTHRRMEQSEVIVDPKYDLYSGIFNDEFKNILD